jgi:hypothetical protein
VNNTDLLNVKFGSLAYTGASEDKELSFYKANGATSNCVTDAESEYLTVQGYPTGTRADKWKAFLATKGYTGATDDIQKQWLFNNPLSSLNLDFANSTALDSRVTFTRASNATRTNSAGLLETVPTNLLLYSEQFDNAAWLQSSDVDVDITANAATAPDGTTTADRLYEATTTTAARSVTQATASVSATAQSTTSIYAKAGERNFLLFRVNNASAGGDYIYATFNISAGTVALSGVAGTGVFTSASIISVGNGWYRCSITGTPSTAAGSTKPNFFMVATSTASATYVGVVNSGLFIWGAQLEAGSTASTYIPTTASLSGAPRFDYDPVTLQPKGLLIEEARTNLFTYSEQFDNATWTKTNTTITADATTAPGGTTTADKLVSAASTTQQNASRSTPPTVVSGTTYCASVFVQAAGANYCQLLFGAAGFTTSLFANFDLSLGVVGTKTAATSGIDAVGNGFYRVWATAVATASTTTQAGAIYLQTGASNTAAQPFVGDGTSGLFVWGAQLEAGAFPTSYIPTVASQVTRAADVASMTGTNFSSWYNQTEGTFVAQGVSAPVNNILQHVYTVSDGASANTMFTRRTTSGVIATAMVTASVSQGDIGNAAVAASAQYKTAYTYKVNDLAISTNGSAVLTDTLATLPTLSRILLGANSANVTTINGHISRITYYNTRLTDAQLQTLST